MKRIITLKEKIIRNILFSGVSNTSMMVVGFLLMPFMISRLGVIEYGLIGISAIFAVGGCVSLFEMGFQSSISKYVAEYNAKNNHIKIAKIICTSVIMFLLSGLILAISGILLSNFIVENFLKIPEEYHLSFRIALLIIFSSYVFQFPNFVVVGFLSGMQRFDILKGVQIVVTVLYAGGVTFLLWFGHNYLSIIIFQTCVLFLQFSFYLWRVLRDNKFLRFKFSTFSISSMKEVFGMTKFLFVNRLSGLVFHNTPRIIVGMFLGPVFMTSYEAVIKISRMLKVALGFINSAIMPAASELYANKNTDILRKLFLKTCRYQMVAVFPVVTGIMFLAQSFYKLWLGADFVKLAPLLWIALVFNLTIPFITVGGAIMVGMNRKLKSFTLLGVMNTLLSVAIILLLIQEYKLASVFIGLSSSILTMLPFYLRRFFKELNIKVETFLREIVVVAALVIFPLLLISVVNKIVVYDNYFTLFAKGSMWCFSYWVLLYIFVLDDEDRDILKELKKKVLVGAKISGPLGN